ncbi:MAG TPA: membrane protein insertion efficiency factor YidD [Actinomycetota bacterium]|nr:membrane protein insertion efficiency factor YidD [Actinomycetota bacterium]
MRRRLARGAWIAGAPARHGLIALIWLYRVSVGGLMGGQCRFYPSCSAYAEQAIRQQGAVRGVALAVWRVARCSPLSKGGVDYPPQERRAALGRVYDNDIHRRLGGPLGSCEEAAT